MISKNKFFEIQKISEEILWLVRDLKSLSTIGNKKYFRGLNFQRIQEINFLSHSKLKSFEEVGRGSLK